VVTSYVSQRVVAVTNLVMNYTVNPILSGLKSFFKALVAAQERSARAHAAQRLASMGYYEEAKQLMLKEAE
jgi:hypothetical protein